MFKKLLEKTKSEIESIRIIKNRIKEKRYLELLDYQLQDYMKKEIPDFFCMGELYSLIFYHSNKISGILARLAKNRKEDDYLGTITFAEGAKKSILSYGMLDKKVSRVGIHQIMYDFFFYNLKKGMEEGYLIQGDNRKILEELIKGTNKEKEIRKRSNFRVIK